MLCSAVAYRADGITAANNRLSEKVSALKKEIQGAMCATVFHCNGSVCMLINAAVHCAVCSGGTRQWLRCTALSAPVN